MGTSQQCWEWCCESPRSHQERLAGAAGDINRCRCAGLKTGVIGVPKTIDGDLKNGQVATSFGFDTACKVRCCMPILLPPPGVLCK